MRLTELGWNDFFAAAFQEARADASLEPARVAVEHRGGYVLFSERGELIAEASGKLRHATVSAGDRPAVGDWVAVQISPHSNQAKIHAVLPRRTSFSRQTAGKRTDEQVLAANIDAVFVVASLGHESNLRSIERYLAMAWESGAQPAVILTKADLSADVDARVAAVRAIAGQAAVRAVCSLTGLGMEAVKALLPPTHTAAVLGPSGVGKSTLINHWSGAFVEDTQPVRDADQKGRHTTTHRHLIRLPDGGLIIDTPGLRELQLWEGAAGIESTFDDVEQLAARCRFSNCRHQTEPGCAVRAALEDGRLDPARFESHQKLRREMKRFANKHDKQAQAEEKRRVRASTRFLRDVNKKRRS